MIRRSTHQSSPSWTCARSRGSRQHHLRGFGDLLVVAQEVRACEEITGIPACLRRHGAEQLLGVAAALAGERETHLGDREIGAPQPFRRTHRGVFVGGDKPLLHASLVIGPTQEVGVALEHLLLDIGGIGSLRHVSRTSALAPSVSPCADIARARTSRPIADCGGEPSKKLMRPRRLGVLDPEHRLGPAAERAEAGPARIGGR